VKLNINNVFIQAIIVFFLSVFLGMGFNLIRENSIPLFGNSISDTSNFSVDISTAKRLFYEKKALFIDARPKEFYKRAHIKGAINIPPGYEENLIERLQLPKDKIIITYCDDKTCGLSKELALELYSLGFDNVYYLKEGFKEWISHNLPIEELK